jgi:hypothetical protein
MGGINGLPSMAPLGSAIVPSYLAYLRVESEVHTKTEVKAAWAVFGGRGGIRKGQMAMDVLKRQERRVRSSSYPSIGSSGFNFSATSPYI